MNARRVFNVVGVLLAGALGSFACSPEVVTPSAASPSAATDQSQNRVVLLEHPNRSEVGIELFSRVRSELTIAGFEVVSLPASGEGDPASVNETRASELQPIAVIYLVERSAEGAEPSHIELWLSNRLSRRTFRYRLPLDGEDAERGYPRLAVQVVEVLRARLARPLV